MSSSSTGQHVVRAGILLGVTLFFSLVALAVAATGGGRRFTWVARQWSRAICRGVGVRVEVDGADRRLESQAYVVMANHSSHFDVIAMYAGLPFDVRPVAKRELGLIPLFGWVLLAGAAIMIDRGDRRRATASIERAGRTIRGGRSVLMFPEGTRTPPGEVGPLKKGPFHLALTAQVPVLPVGVEGAAEVLPPGSWRIEPGVIRVRVGEPIGTAGSKNRPEARTRLAGQVRAALGQLSNARLTPEA